jgi:hypothetical protein
MSKQKPLEYPHFNVVAREEPAGTWTINTTELDQATAMRLLPSRYNHPARIVVMHRDLTVKAPFHPPAQRCNFMVPPSRRPRGKGECAAYLYAHPVYSDPANFSDEGGFAQHVRWRALDGMFDLFADLNGYDSYEKVEQLKQATIERVDKIAEGGTLPEFYHRDSQFTAEHPGWAIGWTGRSGGYFTLVPNMQHPGAPGREYYRCFWAEETGELHKDELETMARVVYDFDLVCCDIIYDAISEGHVRAFGESHIVPLGFT